MDDREEGACVYEASGEAEAQHVKAFLEAHDIPCRFKGETLRTTYGFTLDGLGVVRILVPPRHVAQARELLSEADAGSFRLAEEESAEPDSTQGQRPE
jgi:hypothetical protein